MDYYLILIKIKINHDFLKIRMGHKVLANNLLSEYGIKAKGLPKINYRRHIDPVL